jgi:anti-sigma factor RsiW
LTHPGDLLSAYVDSELPAAERAEVESHLAACSGCQAELAAISYSRNAVRALPVETEPEDVAVLPSSRWRRRWVPTAAAAVMALIVGIAVANPQETPLPLEQVVDQHSARASLDPGSNVLQVRAVFTP